MGRRNGERKATSDRCYSGREGNQVHQASTVVLLISILLIVYRTAVVATLLGEGEIQEATTGTRCVHLYPTVIHFRVVTAAVVATVVAPAAAAAADYVGDHVLQSRGGTGTAQDTGRSA